APAGAPETTRAGIGLTHAIRDACLFQIVGAHLHLHGVTRGDLDEVLAKLARDMGEHGVPVGELNPEHRPWQYGDDLSLHFDRFAVRHKRWLEGRESMSQSCVPICVKAPCKPEAPDLSKVFLVPARCHHPRPRHLPARSRNDSLPNFFGTTSFS